MTEDLIAPAIYTQLRGQVESNALWGKNDGEPIVQSKGDLFWCSVPHSGHSKVGAWVRASRAISPESSQAICAYIRALAPKAFDPEWPFRWNTEALNHAMNVDPSAGAAKPREDS